MSTKIFIGGLLEETTEKDIIDYFSKFGVIEMCNLVINKQTKLSRRFAFLLFKDDKISDKVINNKEIQHYILGKKVDCKSAKDNNENSISNNNSNTSNNNSSMNYSNISYNNNNNILINTNNNNNNNSYIDSRKLFLGGLVNGIKEKNVELYFANYFNSFVNFYFYNNSNSNNYANNNSNFNIYNILNSLSIEVFIKKNNGKCRGFGFVIFNYKLNNNNFNNICYFNYYITSILSKKHVINNTYIDIKLAYSKDDINNTNTPIIKNNNYTNDTNNTNKLKSNKIYEEDNNINNNNNNIIEQDNEDDELPSYKETIMKNTIKKSEITNNNYNYDYNYTNEGNNKTIELTSLNIKINLDKNNKIIKNDNNNNKTSNNKDSFKLFSDNVEEKRKYEAYNLTEYFDEVENNNYEDFLSINDTNDHDNYGIIKDTSCFNLIDNNNKRQSNNLNLLHSTAKCYNEYNKYLNKIIQEENSYVNIKPPRKESLISNNTTAINTTYNNNNSTFNNTLLINSSTIVNINNNTNNSNNNDLLKEYKKYTKSNNKRYNPY